MAGPIIVDDSDSRVQYLPDWDIDPFAQAVGGTRRKAVHAGQTATLAFHGTGIQVVSAAESVVNAGHPQMTFSIDNGAFVQTVSQKLLPDGKTTFNVTVFSKRDLPLGAHQLVITNNNATSPSTFWLDYFLVHPFSPTVSSSTSAQSSGSSNSDTISTNTVTASTSNPTIFHPHSDSHSSAPPIPITTLVIILGVIGSISLTILILGTVFFVRRRRLARGSAPTGGQRDDVPYGDHKSLVSRTDSRSSYFPSSARYASLFRFTLPRSKQPSATPSFTTHASTQATGQSWHAV